MAEQDRIEILDAIPFNFDFDTYSELIHLTSYPDSAAGVEGLLAQALPLIKPKALYTVSYIRERTDSTVALEKVTFTSRVLSANLQEVERVFPYIATCGNELEELACSQEDFLTPFWIDTLKEMALKTAREYLLERIRERFRVEQPSSMNPGSGNAGVWPIRQQRELFSLFGRAEESIGVALTPSFLMTPNKTVSGIFFPATVHFESCQLCTRQDCPRRRAAYTGFLHP